jgi:predicted RND superfamily exporter protein
LIAALVRRTEFPVQRPAATLALAGLLTLFFVAGLGRLEIDSSLESMAVQGDALHALHDRNKDVFGSDEVLSIAVPFEDALSPEALALQRRLAEAIEALAVVAEVESLTTIDDIDGSGDMLSIGPLIPDGDPSTLSNQEIGKIRARVARHPLLTGLLISKNGRTAALQVRFDHASTESERNAALAAIDTLLAAELGDRPFYLAGHLFMKSEIARTIARDLTVLLPVTIGVMALLLFAAMRCWRSALLSLGGVLLAVLWMLGAMGWVGIPLTAMSNTAPTILLALGTAYILHLAAAAQRRSDHPGTAAQVAKHALREVRFGMLVAGVTTIVGYGSLTLSRVPVVRGFGFTLAIGILAVMGVGLFVLPAGFAWVRPRGDRGVFGPTAGLGEPLLALARLTNRKARLVLASAIGLSAIAAVSILGIEVDSSGPKRFPPDSRFRVSSEFYRTQLSGDVLESVYLAGPKDRFLEPDTLRRIRAFQRDAEALPEIDRTISIADYVAFMNREMFGGGDDMLRIPATPEEVGQYVFLYTASGDPEEFDDLIDPDAGRARIILKADVPSSRASAALRAKLTALAQRHFPDEATPDAVLSTEILLSRAAEAVVHEQIQSFSLALLLILGTVMLSFRSLSAGLHMLLPNGLPLVLNLSIMSLLDISLSDATSIISVTALGIAVDSSVHLLVRTRALESQHGSRSAAVLQALLTTGRPIVLTTVLIVAGFSVLMLSDFQSVSELGIFTALTMIFCLFGDLLVLPAQFLAGRRVPASRKSRAVAVESDGTLLAALLREDPHGGRSLTFLGELPRCPGDRQGGSPQPVRLRPLDADEESSHRIDLTPGEGWVLLDGEPGQAMIAVGGP